MSLMDTTIEPIRKFQNNVNVAAEQIRDFHRLNGSWPELHSDFVEQLPLSETEIAIAVEEGLITVVFPPMGPAAYLTVPA